jgi:hypothetical protein
MSRTALRHPFKRLGKQSVVVTNLEGWISTITQASPKITMKLDLMRKNTRGDKATRRRKKVHK